MNDKSRKSAQRSHMERHRVAGQIMRGNDSFAAEPARVEPAAAQVRDEKNEKRYDSGDAIFTQ